MSLSLNDQIQYAEQQATMYRSAAGGMVEAGTWTQQQAQAQCAMAEAVVRSLRLLIPPPGKTAGTLPVVCHFANLKDRAAFVALMEKRK